MVVALLSVQAVALAALAVSTAAAPASSASAGTFQLVMKPATVAAATTLAQPPGPELQDAKAHSAVAARAVSLAEASHQRHLSHLAQLRALAAARAAQARAAAAARAAQARAAAAAKAASSAPKPVSTGSSSGSSSGGSLGGTLGCSGLERLWIVAGGSPSHALMAAEIAMAESGGNQYAHSPTNDFGYWQINGSHGGMASYDPMTNARAAISISGDGTNWSPWTTYTSGAYQGKC